MRLYNLNDDPDGIALDEETTSEAIWADSHEEAVRIYRGRCGFGEDTAIGGGAVDDATQAAIEREFGRPDRPGVEGRLAVLRLAGWGSEDGSQCDSCGLWDMDLEQYAVCPECGQCRECGHADDCPGCEPSPGA